MTITCEEIDAVLHEMMMGLHAEPAKIPTTATLLWLVGECLRSHAEENYLRHKLEHLMNVVPSINKPNGELCQ